MLEAQPDVLDAIHGYVILAERLLSDGATFASGWNFGPDETSGATVREVADRFLASWGSLRKCVVASERAPHEAHSLRLDSTRARTLLEWRPKLDLAQSIEATASWYRAWLNKEDMRERTRRDLDAFRSV